MAYRIVSSDSTITGRDRKLVSCAGVQLNGRCLITLIEIVTKRQKAPTLIAAISGKK